jgi:hypothetical protein
MKLHYLKKRQKLAYKRNYRGFLINDVSKSYKNINIKYSLKNLAEIDKSGLKSVTKE